MANGINDILSVYRQSVASERQTRVAEMQMALQSLQKRYKGRSGQYPSPSADCGGVPSQNFFF